MTRSGGNAGQVDLLDPRVDILGALEYAHMLYMCQVVWVSLCVMSHEYVLYVLGHMSVLYNVSPRMSMFYMCFIVLVHMSMFYMC